MMHVNFPDRKEITLCEAVTALVYGKAYDLVEYHDRFGETPQTSEQSSKAKELLAQLQQAAYAGRVKFRAIPEGADPADGYKDIDPLFFYTNPLFHWTHDVIVQPENESSRPWHFVHLDRDDFLALLRDTCAPVQQNSNTDAPVKVKTFTTGAPGRPTSKHLVVKIAERRFAAGDIPDTLKEFCDQLAADLKESEPDAAPMTSKTIQNTLRQRWRTYQNSRPK